MFFHYYGVIGEHPKTPLKSQLVNEEGDKYSQAVHISHYPDNIPGGTFKKSSSSKHRQTQPEFSQSSIMQQGVARIPFGVENEESYAVDSVLTRSML